MKSATILAMCVMGGVGKTSLSAIITRVLIERDERRVLAIDADPASGLAGALGFNGTKTVDDVRNELPGAARGGVMKLIEDRIRFFPKPPKSPGEGLENFQQEAMSLKY